jgi:hypothetical protein
MTDTTAFQPDQSRQSGSGVAASVVIGILAAIAVLALFTAGMTFLGLAIAFPIAVPVAQQFHVAVSATDVALAEQFAAFWWVFGVFSVASFVGAGVVTIKAIQHLSPAPRD